MAAYAATTAADLALRAGLLSSFAVLLGLVSIVVRVVVGRVRTASTRE